MTVVPISKGQHSLFTPPSFASIAPAPSFRFRPPTPYDKEDYRYALRERGLRFWSREEFQAETIVGLREMWAGDDEMLEANITRLRAFWELEAQAEKDPTLAPDPDEEAAVRELMMKLMDAWPMLNRMNADNIRFNERAPRIALGLYLTGWKNFDLPFRLEGGRIPDELLFAVIDKLEAVESEAIAAQIEGVHPGLSLIELTSNALSLMGLTGDAEKNSPSPSPSPDTLSGSTTDGETAAAKSDKSATIASPPETIPATT
jgi:hypothetical protein